MIALAAMFTTLGVLAFLREDYVSAAIQFFAAAFIAWQNGKEKR